MPRGSVNRIRLWRDDHSGTLIGSGGTRRPDWPARVLANNVSTRIDRLHVCRDKWQLTATCPCTHAIDRSSHAGYRSILVLTSLACTRAGQSVRCVPLAPIRMRELSSRISGQRRILYTRPRGTPEHERQLVTPFRNLDRGLFPFHCAVPYLTDR